MGGTPPAAGPARVSEGASVWARRLLLPRLRASVRGRTYRRIWLLTAVGYVAISVFIGQMVVLIPPSPGASQIPTQVSWLGYGQVSNPYLAPALLVVTQYVVVALPFWGSLVMTALGVGIGLSVASTVSVFLQERRRQAEVAASGLAPAVTGWAFLGACCCTTCAAQVAATGVVGAAVGATPSELLTESWPLAVLQLVVVGLSLLYLEYRLERPALRVRVQVGARRLAGAIGLRIALLIAAITWLFAVVVEWSEGAPLDPGSAYHWTVEHGALGVLALATALAPVWTGAVLRRRSIPVGAVRAVLLVGAITWGLWVPPILVDRGLGGFVNELLGVLGAPAGWGAVAPDSPLGPALYFHWAAQHLLLAGWAAAVAVAPRRTLDAVSVGEAPAAPARPASAPAAPVPVAEAKGSP
jgi:hypothetical protein